MNADLDGYQEVPMALSTAGSGELRVRFNRHDNSFEYKLTYEDLEGIVTQAHIHFGRPGVNGGISVWLCGTSANPGPAGTPTCPGPNSGEVSGTITSAQVVGPEAQGIAPGEFDELVRAMREGATYANVHTDTRP
ncbi:MAG TPA: CHRD domain-containing protein, partial [Burkholderiales bacterium]|nr:CHRD domain-containing protein [Burkholderiales bacterium]